MKFFQILITGVWLTAVTAGAQDEPPLPAWNDAKQRSEKVAGGWLASGVLLADEPLPDEPPSVDEPLEIELPLAGEIGADLAPFAEVGEKFLSDYFAERPVSFLIDPQGLLAAADSSERLSFLNYHAGDSSIDLFVYLLAGDQQIPSGIREEEIPERFFSGGRPAAVVFYYLGSPRRAVLRVSPALWGAIPAAEQHRALESSVMQALERAKPAEQLEKFLVQMSIRIYWMERMVGGGVASSVIAAPVAGLPVTAGETQAIERFARIFWLRQKLVEFAVPVALGLTALVLMVGLQQWLRRRARYRFPELEVEPRLGGEHAAGIGAVISFASAGVPPASQRDQVPDYLRRA